MNIAFFDFDGTLTRRDSLFAFVAFVHGRGRLYRGLLSRCWILVGYILGLISNTAAKQALMRYFFAGMEHAEFIGYCERFTSVLESMLRKSALDRLEWHKQRGDKVVLVSASFEEYLAPLCQRLGMECIGTQLEVVLPKSNGLDSKSLDSSVRQSSTNAPNSGENAMSGGILSGDFATPNCYGAQKVIRIRAHYVLDTYTEIYVYGDSKGDREMLTLATTPSHAFYKPFR